MKKLFSNRLMCVLLTVLCTLAFSVLINYFLLPAFNLGAGIFWFYIWLIGIYAFGIVWAFNFFYKVLHKQWKSCSIDISEFPAWAKWQLVNNKIPSIAAILVVLWTLAIFLTSIPGWKIISARQYANLIEINDGDFKNDIINLESSNNVVSVDLQTAKNLGNRVIGSMNNSSWYNVDDEYNLVSIAGELYRISPLEYVDVFKFWKAGSIPGYVLVNAKTQEANYVPLDKPMKYSTSAYFQYDLKRHIHMQFPTYIFGKSFFEVDDDGNPYWITPVKTSHIGIRAGYLEKSAIITDAVSGESTEYTLDEISKLGWVDHVHSVSYLMDLVTWHYEYQNGFFNFSATDKYTTSYSFRSSKEDDSDESGTSNSFTPFDGYNSSLSATGEILFSTGITPTNKSESVSGFVLISPRTGEAKFYDVQGAEESSAQASAEGLVSDLRYSASYPVVTNVSGIPSYFMELKDKAGIVRKYAISGIKDYSIVVVADSIPEVIAEYKSKLGIGVSSTEAPQNVSNIEFQLIDLNGTVTQVKEAQVDGYTHYYFTLDSSDLIFMSSIRNNNMQPFYLVEGAIVSIKYYIWDEPSVGIVRNITFGMNLW